MGSARTWTALLFVVGSACFLVAPLPTFLDLVGDSVDAGVFFVGSLFFTSAATLQWLPGRPPRDLDWWSSSWQLLGTLFFNVTTYRALDTALGSADYDQVVWRPDAFGSVCFLVSGVLAYVAVAGAWWQRAPLTTPGLMAGINLAGCVLFGISALAAYVVPSTAEEVDAAVANATTSLGALAFLVGALLMLRKEPVPV